MATLPDRLAREAREDGRGYLDACHYKYREAPGDDLCPVCQACERVAALAVRAALDEAAKIARDITTDCGYKCLACRTANTIAAAIETLKG